MKIPIIGPVLASGKNTIGPIKPAVNPASPSTSGQARSGNFTDGISGTA
jgi:hypothetical protein